MEGRRTQKTKLTLSLIHRINLRLGGATPYGARVHHAPYQMMKFGARAPHSLDAARKVLRRLLETPSGLQA